MVLSILANGLIICVMAMVVRPGQTAPSIKASGEMIKLVDKENLFMLMVMCMRANG